MINDKHLIDWLNFEIGITEKKERELLELGIKTHSYENFRLAEQQADFRAALVRVLGKVERMKI